MALAQNSRGDRIFLPADARKEKAEIVSKSKRIDEGEELSEKHKEMLIFCAAVLVRFVVDSDSCRSKDYPELLNLLGSIVDAFGADESDFLSRADYAYKMPRSDALGDLEWWEMAHIAGRAIRSLTKKKRKKAK